MMAQNQVDLTAAALTATLPSRDRCSVRGRLRIDERLTSAPAGLKFLGLMCGR
jgi:hypothetical protein